MSPFRRNLERLRDDHRATRYPGDLAADVLGKLDRASTAHDTTDATVHERHELLDGGPIPITRGNAASRWRAMLWPVLGASAVAAALAVALTLAATRGMQNDGHAQPVIAGNLGQTEQRASTPTDTTTAQTPVAGSELASNTDTDEAIDPSAQTESFTLVPAVASLVGEDASLVPAAPSFDFDLSVSANSTSTGSESAEN